MLIGVINNGNTGNNGVMAMAIALNNEILQIDPRVKLVVASDNPFNRTKDEKRYKKYGIHTEKNSLGDILCKHYWLFPILSMIWFLQKIFTKPKKNLTGFDIRYYDAVVSLCGEDFFSDNWPWRTCLFTFLQCQLAFIKKKPLIILANTFGPFNRQWSRYLAQYCFKKSVLITARDQNSYNIVRGIVPEHKNLHYTADLAFLLEAEKFDCVLKEHKEISTLPEKFIGISVSNLFGKSVFTHLNKQNERCDMFIATMAKGLDRLIKRSGLDVVFINHVIMNETNDDRLSAELIKEKMKAQKKVNILHDEYTAPEVKAIIGKSHIFIGCRMHALIAALSQAVPTLALAYSPKTIDVVGKGLNYSSVIDARDINSDIFLQDFARKTDSLLNKSRQINEHIAKALPKVQNFSKKNTVELMKILNYYKKK